MSLYIPILPVRVARLSALATVDDLLAEAADALILGQVAAGAADVLDLEIVALALEPIDAHGVHFARGVVALGLFADAVELGDGIANARPVGAGSEACCRGRGSQERHERNKPRDLHGERENGESWIVDGAGSTRVAVCLLKCGDRSKVRFLLVSLEGGGKQ